MTPQIHKTLQEVFILATGRPASAAEIAWLETLSGADNSWAPLVNAINSYMSGLAQQQGTAGAFKTIASKGLGITLSDADATQLALLVNSGQMKWSDIFIHVISDTGELGTILNNRASASYDFLADLAARNISERLDNSAIHLEVDQIIDRIGASPASLLSGGAEFSALAARLSTSGLSVESVAITSATGIMNSRLNAPTVFGQPNGDVVSITVTMSEATTVTGTPQLALNIGGVTVQANYTSGSGSNALVFTYMIQPGQNDADGISIDANSLKLNGGSLKNALGVNASIEHAAVADNSGYMVDTIAHKHILPTAATISSQPGQLSTITQFFSEPVVLADPSLIQVGKGFGSIMTTPTNITVSGNTLSFNVNPLGIFEIYSVTDHGITDLAGNWAPATRVYVSDRPEGMRSYLAHGPEASIFMGTPHDDITRGVMDKANIFIGSAGRDEMTGGRLVDTVFLTHGDAPFNPDRYNRDNPNNFREPAEEIMSWNEGPVMFQTGPLDVIHYLPGGLSVVTHATATAGTAAINAQGIATFVPNQDWTTLVAAVEAGINAGGSAARGQFAVFDNGSSGWSVFISDGIDGLGPNDIHVILTGNVVSNKELVGVSFDSHQISVW